MAQLWKIPRTFRLPKEKRNCEVSAEWMLYEARRTLIAELRSHPNAQADALQPADAALPQSLPQTPRTVKQLAEAIREPQSLLQCPFGADFEHCEHEGPQAARWLALVELKSAGFRYAADTQRDLPYEYGSLVATVVAHRRENEPESQSRRTSSQAAVTLQKW